MAKNGTAAIPEAASTFQNLHDLIGVRIVCQTVTYEFLGDLVGIVDTEIPPYLILDDCEQIQDQNLNEGKEQEYDAIYRGRITLTRNAIVSVMPERHGRRKFTAKAKGR